MAEKLKTFRLRYSEREIRDFNQALYDTNNDFMRKFLAKLKNTVATFSDNVLKLGNQ